MAVTGFFMIGYPKEGCEDIEKTIRLSRNLSFNRATFPIFSPLPGTEVYFKLTESGFLKKDSLRPEDFFIDEAGVPALGLSLKDVKRFQKKTAVRFYLRPRIVLNLFREIKSMGQIRIILGRFVHTLF